MKKLFALSYIAIIGITASLAGLLFYVQYVYGERFIYTFDSFSIAGRGTIEVGEAEDITQLTLELDNLLIELSTVQYQTTASPINSYVTLDIDSITRMKQGIEIIYVPYNTIQVISTISTLFENPSHIGIHTAFISTTGDTVASEQTVLYAYRCIKNSKCHQEHNSVQYSFRDETNYTIRGVIDSTMTVPPNTIGVSSHNFHDIYITRSDSPPHLFKPDNIENVQSFDEELRAKRNQYLYNAFQSLSQTRYQPINGTWSSIENETERLFSEELLYIQLIESLRNNQFTAEFNTLRRSATLHSDMLSVFSVLFFGEYAARSNESTKPRLSPQTAIIQEAWPMHTMVDYRDSVAKHIVAGEYSVLINRLLAVDTTTLNLSQLVEHIIFMMIAAPRNTNNIDFLIQNRILPAITTIDENWLVSRQQGTIDLHITAKTVWILRAMHPVNETDHYEYIANRIEYSLLSLTNNSAVHPRFINVRNNTLSSIQGAIDISHVYPWLFSDNYWSFNVLGNSPDTMMWIATPVPLSDLKVEHESISLTIPSIYREQLFYVLMGAISQPIAVVINQQLFVSQADYENFNDGYYWDIQNKTLSIKYQNKNPINTIEIRLQTPL